MNPSTNQDTLLENDLFAGKLVRLVAEGPKVTAEAFTRWSRNTTYWRLLDTDPALLWSAEKWEVWEKKSQEEPGRDSIFMVRRSADDRLIGMTALWAPEWPHAEAWFTIALGEADCWGQGYGSEATRLMLRYGFHELNVHRISLGVFGYNHRAIHVYEKLGFRKEGITRQLIHRAGRYYDIFFMGILRAEWEEKWNWKA